MQVNVEIDQEFLEKALLLSHLKNSNELLQQALQVFVQTLSQSEKRQILLAEMATIAERCAALPDVDTRSESEILGYNQQGLLTNGD